MTSVLESKYVEQTRPYSQNELNDMRTGLYRNFKLGKIKAYHDKCGHFYVVKENGKKEKELKENPDNVGNCSVCWKLSKTPTELKYSANDMVANYVKCFYYEPSRYTYDLNDLEYIFYQWLYVEK
jgi:hypothetical protein